MWPLATSSSRSRATASVTEEPGGNASVTRALLLPRISASLPRRRAMRRSLATLVEVTAMALVVVVAMAAAVRVASHVWDFESPIHQLLGLSTYRLRSQVSASAATMGHRPRAREDHVGSCTIEPVSPRTPATPAVPSIHYGFHCRTAVAIGRLSHLRQEPCTRTLHHRLRMTDGPGAVGCCCFRCLRQGDGAGGLRLRLLAPELRARSTRDCYRQRTTPCRRPETLR